MSERIACLPVLLSEIIPIAIPETGPLTGTPASISAKDPAQTVAIEDEPFDSRISDTMRMVYGLSASGGRTCLSARRARLPCPTSLLPGPRFGFTSPVENPGKL